MSNTKIKYYVPLFTTIFFSTLGLGPGPLELGKLGTKQVWEISINHTFRLERNVFNLYK